MEPLWDFLGFVGKAVVVFVTFAACVGFVFSRARARRSGEPQVLLREVSARWKRQSAALKAALSTTSKGRFRRKPKPEVDEKPFDNRVFVLDFKGDVLASEVDSLREEVTVVIGIARPGDEVVVRLESSGGAVHGYGLAASQLARLRAKDLPLTVCVDKVAASGGYMMACVAQQIAAAPFAILGSIGVVAPVPNLHRLLERHGVDFENVTAGRYKRPVSLLGKVTDEGKQKLKEQLEETHELFKRFVHDMRPKLDVETVATGEHWYGSRALELGLADILTTSDDYLLKKSEGARIFEVLCERPRSVRERAVSLGLAFLSVLQRN
ncbi:MAG: protease SohB [Polyangiaceae bacterium]|nr:protease SohB [Polyangiaceae bacterium]